MATSHNCLLIKISPPSYGTIVSCFEMLEQVTIADKITEPENDFDNLQTNEDFEIKDQKK